MEEATHQTAVLVAITTACLTADALVETLGQKRFRVNRTLSDLLQRGLAERREKGCFTATKLGLDLLAEHGFVPRGAPANVKAPTRRTGTVRQRAWNVMRIKSPFTLKSVTALAVTDADRSTMGLPEWFLALERAGYLRRDLHREHDGRGGHGLVRYRLIRNTGMLAPVHSTKYACIRDPNTGEDTPCKK